MIIRVGTGDIGEALCPRCQNNKTDFWVKVAEDAVSLAVAIVSIFVIKRLSKA
jgi:hypothetical protein